MLRRVMLPQRKAVWTLGKCMLCSRNSWNELGTEWRPVWLEVLSKGGNGMSSDQKGRQWEATEDIYSSL